MEQVPRFAIGDTVYNKYFKPSFVCRFDEEHFKGYYKDRFLISSREDNLRYNRNYENPRTIDYFVYIPTEELFLNFNSIRMVLTEKIKYE